MLRRPQAWSQEQKWEKVKDVRGKAAQGAPGTFFVQRNIVRVQWTKPCAKDADPKTIRRSCQMELASRKQAATCPPLPPELEDRTEWRAEV